ncbi:MAG: hypothetical protein NVV74_04945 [Magnetospirillum sp.]|nr:hypothetical protein [Magnetospirillum sp.]
MVLALGPAGCGFQPIYARDDATPSAVSSELAAVQVNGIENRIGQQLRNQLVLSLSPNGEPAAARYGLSVKVTETLQGLANSRDGNATVGNVMLLADYTLTELSTGRILHASRAISYSSFRFLGPRYGSTVSERESETAALTEVAAEIRGALTAFFTDRQVFEQRRKARPVLIPAQTPETP